MAEALSAIARQVQYTALLSQLDVEMPQVLRDFLSVFSILNIDPALILGRASLPHVTWRVIFFLVACCVPLILAVLLIALSQPLIVIPWFLSLMLGGLALLVGMLVRVLPGSTEANKTTGNNLMIVGGSVFGAALLLLLAKFIRAKYFSGDDEDDDDEDEVDHDGDENKNEDKKSKAKNKNNKNKKNNEGDDNAETEEAADDENEDRNDISGGVNKADLYDDEEEFDNSNLNNTHLDAEAEAELQRAAKAEGWSFETMMARRLEINMQRFDEMESRQSRRNKLAREYAQKFHRRRTLTHILFLFVFLFAGLVLTGIVSFSTAGMQGTTKQVLGLPNSAYNVVGIILLTFAGLAFVYMVMNLFYHGRVVSLAIGEFLHQNMLRLFIVAVLLSFIPVISYCLDAFLCTNYVCPFGTKFNPSASRPAGSYTKDPVIFCDACVFTHSTLQPRCNSTPPKCDYFSESRLYSTPTSSCGNDGHVYVIVAASITIVVYTVGVPFLFFSLTRDLTSMIPRQAKIIEVVAPAVATAPKQHHEGNNNKENTGEQQHQEQKEHEQAAAETTAVTAEKVETVEATGNTAAALTEDDIVELNWQKQQAAVPAIAGSLYAPFTYRMRFYVLFDLIQRFSFTLVLNIIAPFSRVATALVLAGHAIVFCVQIFLRPYVDRSLQIFATLLSGANVLNSTLMVALWGTGDGNKLVAFAYVCIVVNSVISVVGGVIFAVLEFRAMGNKSKATEEEEEALRKSLDEEMQLLAAEAAAATATSHNKKQLGDDSENQNSNDNAPDVIKEEDNKGQEEEQQQQKEGQAITTSTSSTDFDAAAKHKSIADRLAAIEQRKNHNKVITITVHDHTISFLSKRYMPMAIMLALALAFSVLGVLREPEAQFVVGTNSLYQSVGEQLGGFGSWSNFTENCCCAVGTAPFDDYNVTERWVCYNGKTVLRGRQSKDGADNGLPIRGLCNTTFHESCVVTVNTILGRAVLTCSDAVTKDLRTNKGVSDAAMRLYW